MKGFRWGAASFLFAVLASGGCGDKEPILIGAVGDLQTGGRANASGFRNGVAFAEEAINDNGGIGGTLVRVVFADDQGDPSLVPKVDEKLVASGAVALVGHNTSATTAAALPVLERHNILLLGPEATSSEFSGKDDYFSRVEVVEQSMADVLATHAVQKMKLKSIGVMLDEKNRPFSRPFFEAFAKKVKALGGEAEILYPYTVLDRAEAGRQVVGFLSRRGQAILLVSDGVDSRLLAQLVRKVRTDFPLLGTPWVIPPSRADDLTDPPEGMVFPCTWDPDSQNAAYLEFKSGYERRFNMAVDYHAVHAYEAMMILAKGLEEAGRNRKKLHKAVSSITSVSGLQGPIQIDAYGDCTREIFLLKFRDGKPRRVEAKPGT